MTNPRYPLASAVLETALAQICQEGFSMTVANDEMGPADQSRDMCALVKARRQSRICRERHPMSKTVAAKDAETALGLAEVVVSGKEQMCTCEGRHNGG